MRKSIWLAGLLSLLCFSSLAAAVDKKTAADIDREIEKVRLDMAKVRRFIHMNPQTANRESETAKIISSRLAALGLDIKTGVARTGVVALLRGEHSGPTVALRAGMDAVPVQETAEVDFKSLNPGIMHATGNDLHAAIVLGAASVLTEMKDRIKGNVKFLFQPACEGAPPDEDGGAALMIKEGVLENPRGRGRFLPPCLARGRRSGLRRSGRFPGQLGFVRNRHPGPERSRLAAAGRGRRHRPRRPGRYRSPIHHQPQHRSDRARPPDRGEDRGRDARPTSSPTASGSRASSGP